MTDVIVASAMDPLKTPTPPTPCSKTPTPPTPCSKTPTPPMPCSKTPTPPCLHVTEEGEGEVEEGCHHDNRKVEEQKHCNPIQPKRKMKPKGKLVRSKAICEDIQDSQASSSVEGHHHHHTSSGCRDDDDDNRAASCKDDSKSRETKKQLSKEPSVEYTDSTGIDLHQFIVDTLNSNPRDRMMLLNLEHNMVDYINSNSPFKKFPHMSSYHRMLVHRVAAYFGMEHNVDQTGKAVIINRTPGTRIPEKRFLDEVVEQKTEDIQQWKAILKRNNSSDDQPSRHHHPSLSEIRSSRSMEEREEEYQKVRNRIFNQETLCPQENTHAESRSVEEYSAHTETQRRRQLFRGSRDASGSASSSSSWTGSRQSSTETDGRHGNHNNNEPCWPWSSTDSTDSSSYQWSSPAPKPRPPPPVAASHHSNNSWGAPPPQSAGSISLYRVAPPSCARPPSPHIPEEAVVAPPPASSSSSSYIMENGIPPGSILVNPHTGQPFLNPDGTPVVYNPPDSLQQPIRSQTQPQGPPPPPQQQVVQYSPVSYAAPQMLSVAPAQPTAYMPPTQVDELSSQFAAHVAVSCQSTGEAPPMYAPPPTQGYVYAAPPPPNPPAYCQPSPQMPVYYYSTQYPAASQTCRPASPSQHMHSQAAPPAGYLGVQGSQSQGQAVLGNYPAMASHQCGTVQTGVMPAVAAEAGYCCVAQVGPPPSHHHCSSQPWTAQY